MAGNILIDTGPLVALINRRDEWHSWATNRVKEITDPLITCEAVLSECSFILTRLGIDRRHLFNFIGQGDLKVASSFINQSDQKRIIDVITSYANLPASFADACLVAMYEDNPSTRIFTIDSDFTIYRTPSDDPLSLISPHY